MSALVGRIARGLARRVTGTITRVATNDPVVALTFDDGPDPAVTPALLEILAAHGARATFFMTGENAAAYPDVVAAVRDAGHALGNHSWDHPSVPLIPGRERRRQIRDCKRVLRGAGMRLFRPPYGHQSVASRLDAWLTGHQVVTWSVCVPDWEDHDGSWLADFALRQIASGSIVLMHDGLVDFSGNGSADRRATLEAVGKILTTARGKYEFVTVPELLDRGRPVRVDWWMEPDVEFLNGLTRRTGVPRRYQTPGSSGR